jgi:hypothetical membrane protein
MLLNVKAGAITGAILAGGTFFLVALANLMFSSYGNALLDLGSSVYPGYRGPGGFGSVIVVTMYAVVDGFLGGALLVWLYNTFAKRSSDHVKM